MPTPTTLDVAYLPPLTAQAEARRQAARDLAHRMCDRMAERQHGLLSGEGEFSDVHVIETCADLLAAALDTLTDELYGARPMTADLRSAPAVSLCRILAEVRSIRDDGPDPF